MAFLGLSQKDFLVFLGEAKIADFISWSPISVYPELLMANYIGNFETASAGHLWPFFGGDSYKLYNNFIKKKHDERNWLSKFLKCDTHVPYLFLKNNQCINPINQSNPIILIPYWEPHDTQIHRLPNSHLIKKTSPKNHQQDHLFENWIFQIILWNLIFGNIFI